MRATISCVIMFAHHSLSGNRLAHTLARGGTNGGAPAAAGGRAPFVMGAIGEDDAGGGNPATLPAIRARSALDKENQDRGN